jgi:hypothetical protein
MNDPITSRQAIESDADLAAQRCVQSGVEQPNNHLDGTEAAQCWERAYQVGLLKHSAAKVGVGA